MRLSRREAGLRIAQLLSSGPLSAKTPALHAIFRSGDGGLNWRRSDRGLPGTSRINALGQSGEAAFAGTDAGIFVSRDGANNWLHSRDTAAQRITAFATAGRIAFAGTDGAGLLQSYNHGAAWSSVANFHGRQVRSLLAAAGRIYVGTNDGDVASSRDGQRWSSLRQGLPMQAQIFALTAVGVALFAGLYAKGLYRWIEEEQRWIKVGGLSPLVLATAAGTLLAGQNPGGIHRSDDLGANWAPAISLAKDGPSGAAPVWAMAGNEKIALAGASGGIFLSIDQGRTWRRCRNGLPAESPGVAFLLRDQSVLAGSIIGPAPASREGTLTKPDKPAPPSKPPGLLRKR